VILESAGTYRADFEEHRRLLADASQAAGQEGLIQHHKSHAAIAEELLALAQWPCTLCDKSIADDVQSWFWGHPSQGFRMHLSCFRSWYSKGLAADVEALSAYDDDELRKLSGD
jgi:hypothetical protein